MKICNVNVDDFFKVVDTCKGDIFCVGDGYRFNLKSQMSRFVARANFADENARVKEMNLELSNSSDYSNIINFCTGYQTC